MLKIAVITAYYGNLPGFFNAWLRSAQANSDIDFYLVTDTDTDFLPSNVKKLPFSFEEFRQLIETKLGRSVKLEKPYKICDYRPMYGVVFEDYLKDYDYWAYADMDVVFGNIRKFIENNNIENYIKFADWSRVISGDIYDLFYFNDNEDLVCLNEKTALKTRVFENRTAHKGSYIYVIESCAYCRLKKYCQGNLKEIRNYRVFDVNYDFNKIKKQVTQNLLSPKGIEMRVNRSSQVEGAFGVIKQDMDYDRARRRGMENVSLEFMLTCLGYNIRKLLSFIEGKAKTDYWKAPPDLKPESIPEIDYDRILKKRKKGENEKLRKTYKHKKRSFFYRCGSVA